MKIDPGLAVILALLLPLILWLWLELADWYQGWKHRRDSRQRLE